MGAVVAGTAVKTEDGDKAIEEIEAGDKVLSYEAIAGRFAYKEVADVIAHDGVTELAHVTISRKAAADKATEGEIAGTETGSTETVISETIDSTTNHPYFIVGYGYVDAGNLVEGDTVLLANGKEAKVEKVKIEFLTEPVTVYNFEVKDWHCYFVGEAGVLVHNGSCANASGAGNIGGDTIGNSGEGGSGVRNRIGNSVKPMEKTMDMSLNPEIYANEVANKYGINLKGSGQKIRISYNPELTSAGRTRAVNPNIIEIGPSSLFSEEELANTIAHELNHARSFIRGGNAPEWGTGGAYPAGNALAEYIRGER